MARIPLLPVEEAKEAASKVGMLGLKAGLSIYRVLLRQPQLAKRISDLTDVFAREAEIDARLRELIVMRVGWSQGGVYEWSQHWRIALFLGIEESDLLAVRNWEAYDHWSPRDRAALRATDESLDNGVISRETWDELATHFENDRERIELVTIIGCWKMLSELLRSLEVPLDEGLAPWPPGGVAPERSPQ